jgi:hypothetical protein
MGVDGQRHRPAAFRPLEGDPVSIELEVWANAEKFAPTGIRSPDRPALGE